MDLLGTELHDWHAVSCRAMYFQRGLARASIPRGHRILRLVAAFEEC